MKTVTIDVTQEDIDKGERGDACKCPIALACHRILKEGVWVCEDLMSISGEDEDVVLPDEAQDFIKRFDYGHSPEPFTFTIQIP
jgi:hypothetical protein